MRDGPDFEFFALQEALLGRYSLDREIGRGGMGIVYLAHEVALDRPVALKLLPPQMAAQPTLRERARTRASRRARWEGLDMGIGTVITLDSCPHSL